MEIRLYENSSQRKPSKRSVSLSFIERRLNRLTLSKPANESSEAIKGPLGLSLLHEPSEPLIDFIFVHGLAGGSRKTWSSSENPAQFWPKEWLPSETGFKHVRIHTYGYNSDWAGKKQTVLYIHDFGQDLLADIHNSPNIRKNSNTPIVLIAHSMGGLVIKKAYLLAIQDPNYQQIAKRIHSMFFLASPHRGADSAKLLKNLLRVSLVHHSKAYVDELVPNSRTVQIINDQFRHVYQNIQLWSFFETVKTNLGYTQELIVGKDSATLGLPGEHIQLLNADHRHVCKFEDRSDPNYISLRNAFIVTIDNINENRISSKHDEHRAEMMLISEYIGISQRPETDLMTATDRITQGSCLWLTDGPSFRDWFDGSEGCDSLDSNMPNVPKCFWLSGKPGTGKSTATGHVINYIEDCNCDCSFYFFNYGDEARSNIAEMLRSLAYQMAYVNFEIRQAILTMVREGESFNKNDPTTIWRIFFLLRICRAEFHRPHYWVLDALDECRNHSVLFQLLSKIDKKVPLRIFITSRPLPSIQRLFLHEMIPVFEVKVQIEDSLRDIELFLQAHARFLPVNDESACHDLIAKILQKCEGSFLWATVVLRELKTVYSLEQIQDVLDSVPGEMDDLYKQILQGVAAVPSSVELAKSILRWTICAIRPLTTEELAEALRLDINHNVPQLERVIESICGHLVYVNSDSRVQTIHETVAAFLTQQGLTSEFAIDKGKEDSRLTEVCLTYLSGKELESSRIRRGNAVTWPTKRSIFAEYASLNFSEHLANASLVSDAPLVLLDSFFKSNILTWIEIIAATGDISPLTRTAENLRSYLGRRAKSQTPLGAEVQTVNTWANDIIHLGAAFSHSLLASPASIHFLTPPVCPPGSAIYQAFAVYPRCLKVVGVSDEGWDDRLSRITYSGNLALSIACRNDYFAVGLSNGSIILYRNATFEIDRQVDHGEPVRHLAFNKLNSLLAASGIKKISVWNIRTGVQLWAVDIRVQLQPMALSFNEDASTLMLASKENYVAFYQVSDGTKLENCPFYDTIGDEEENEYRRSPWDAQFSSELNLLAISYRNRPITLWDLETKRLLGQFHKEGSEDVYPAPQSNHVVFNPIPELSLVAAAFNDGDLVVFDPWDLSQIALYEIAVHVLASSPDGRTLASGDTHGTINLFTFKTLHLIYRIAARDYDVRAIVFAPNSLRFFDIRGDHCNAWEPSVLVRNDSSYECSSESFIEDAELCALFVDARIWNEDRTITVVIDHHGGDFLFCGREDGSIALYAAKTGKVVHELCSHAKMVPIRFLSWNPHEGILASTDTSSRFVIRKIIQTTDGAWIAENPILNDRAPQAIVQVLLSPSGKQLLVSTASYDQVWSLEGYRVGEIHAGQRTTWSWINHPSNNEHILLFEDNKVHIFEWPLFEKLSRAEGVSLHVNENAEFLLTEVLSSRKGHSICLRFLQGPKSDRVPQLVVLDASSIHPKAEESHPIASYESIAWNIKTTVGVYKSLLLFLDTNGWVCSINIGSSRKETSYTKHFIIPFTWHSVGELLFQITKKGSVAFVKRDELVVFHGGIEFEEKVEWEGRGVGWW